MRMAGRRCCATRTRLTRGPRPGEALIRVGAVALNHLDLWQRRGIERVRIPLPHISGADVAGTVVEAPDGPFAPGQRVMLQPGLACGRCVRCLEGRDNECPRYDVLGYQSAGGYAELVRVPVQNLIALPDAIGFVEAAAFPLTFLTAWHMLITRAALQAGETVLVIGAGSGVGQAAIQIARLHGARVMATAGTPEKLARARELGAFETVNHSAEDVPVAVKRADRWPWGGRGGGARRDGDLGGQPEEPRARRPAGDLRRHDRPRRPDRSPLRVSDGSSRSSGLYMGRKGELIRAAAHFFRGELSPVIDRVYALGEAAEAQRRLEARESFGKIVLQP